MKPISFKHHQVLQIRADFRAARGRGKRPRGWKADARHVPSAENRSHGSTLGIKLRRFPDGTRFRDVFS